MDRRRQTIVLVDFHDKGHHMTFREAQLRALLKAGYSVFLIAPQAGKSVRTLSSSEQEHIFCEEYAVESEGNAICRLLRPFRRLWDNNRRLLWLFRCIAQFERRQKQSCGGLFFSCMHHGDFVYGFTLPILVRWAWSGLYLHVAGFEGIGMHMSTVVRPRYFSGKKFKGLAILMQEYARAFEDHFGFRIHCHPDLVHAGQSDEGEKWRERILEQADGRKVITLLGHLDHRKGLSEFIQVSQKLNPTKYYFVVVGKLITANEEERAYLQQITDGNVENCFAYLERIATEEEFNGVVKASDALVAVYKDFKSSSNIQGKGAAFGVPCIVSEGYLMGDRCARFGLGVNVAEGSVTALGDAIKEVISPEYIKAWQAQHSCEDYIKVHSEKALPGMFREIFD